MPTRARIPRPPRATNDSRDRRRQGVASDCRAAPCNHCGAGERQGQVATQADERAGPERKRSAEFDERCTRSRRAEADSAGADRESRSSLPSVAIAAIGRRDYSVAGENRRGASRERPRVCRLETPSPGHSIDHDNRCARFQDVFFSEFAPAANSRVQVQYTRRPPFRIDHAASSAWRRHPTSIRWDSMSPHRVMKTKMSVRFVRPACAGQRRHSPAVTTFPSKARGKMSRVGTRLSSCCSSRSKLRCEGVAGCTRPSIASCRAASAHCHERIAARSPNFSTSTAIRILKSAMSLRFAVDLVLVLCADPGSLLALRGQSIIRRGE